jgi:hypothetical protein
VLLLAKNVKGLLIVCDFRRPAPARHNGAEPPACAFLKVEEAQFSEAALDRSLKDCLLKLQFSDSALGPPRDGSRFELVAYSSDPNTAAHLWVEEPPQPGVTELSDLTFLWRSETRGKGGNFRLYFQQKICFC